MLPIPRVDRSRGIKVTCGNSGNAQGAGFFQKSTRQVFETNMYHGMGVNCIPFPSIYSKKLTYGTPFEQIATRPGERIVEMIGANA